MKRTTGSTGPHKAYSSKVLQSKTGVHSHRFIVLKVSVASILRVSVLPVPTSGASAPCSFFTCTAHAGDDIGQEHATCSPFVLSNIAGFTRLAWLSGLTWFPWRAASTRSTSRSWPFHGYVYVASELRRSICRCISCSTVDDIWAYKLLSVSIEKPPV